MLLFLSRFVLVYVGPVQAFAGNQLGGIEFLGSECLRRSPREGELSGEPAQKFLKHQEER